MLNPTHRRQPTMAVLVTNRSGRQLRWASIIILASILLLVQRAQSPWFMGGYTNMRAVVSPVATMVQTPATAIASINQNLQNWWYAQERNAQLEADFAKLKQWQQLANTLQQENAGLRALLALPASQQSQQLSAKIIGTRQHAAYRNTVLIDHGSQHGVVVDSLVATADGIVGRIVSVEKRAADFIRITDPRMRLPVALPNGQHAVAIGTGSKLLKLAYLETGDIVPELEPGNTVATSREGSIVPAGLPVGKLVTGSGAHSWFIQPFSSIESIDFVQIIAPPLAVTETEN